MKVLFTDCWVGFYVGEGNYEGGPCSDVLFTNVPTDIEDSELFSYYLMGLCHGMCDYDQIVYKSKVVQRRPKRVPVKINSRDELEKCTEVFIEVDYNDLLDWIDEYFDDEDDDDEDFD